MNFAELAPLLPLLSKLMPPPIGAILEAGIEAGLAEELATMTKKVAAATVASILKFVDENQRLPTPEEMDAHDEQDAKDRAAWQRRREELQALAAMAGAK